MHLEVYKIVQGTVHLHHDQHILQVQGQAHGEVQEAWEAHPMGQHEPKVFLDVLSNVLGCSGYSCMSYSYTVIQWYNIQSFTKLRS
jgi:hypothetical protein